MMIPAVRIFCILVSLAATAFSITVSNTPYLGLIAAVVFVLAAYLRQGRDDSRIFIIATGELLVIAVAATSFTAGFIVQGAVIGAVLFDKEGLPGNRDAILFTLWCVAALAVSAFLYFSNQVLLPFLAATAGVVAVTALLVGVQEMQEHRRYAGGN